MPATPSLPDFQVPGVEGEGQMAAVPAVPTAEPTAAEATAVSADKVEALPLAARLPFLLFRD